MGQKVNPIGIRVNINRTWDSRWYAQKDYAEKLAEDLKIRSFLTKKLATASVSKIIIERPAKKMIVTLFTSKPGIIIGKKGADIEVIKKELRKFTKNDDINVNIIEIRKPEIDAKLIAQSVAQQLERRIAFRRAMKRAVQQALRLGALGIRINCSGRLGGAEIARMEWYREGRVPLHTLRADIDYGTWEAHTAYGRIGIKVWVFRGEVMENDPTAHEKRITGANQGQGGHGGHNKHKDKEQNNVQVEIL
ncbi:MAG: 30S ribosomal protein S3 [Proteobacteria bacterium]|nr:30S ribosomal protein S3 [Pseudomonadota bacterium]